MKTKNIIKADATDGDPVMPKEPTEAQKSKETPAQQAQARKADLKSKVADATEEAYPDGESHGAKKNAQEDAAYAHMHAADLASAGPVKDFHKAAAQCHMDCAAEHSKVTASDSTQSGTVHAAGTTAGTLSGHSTKKSAAAALASQAAHEASAEAHGANDDDLHNAAKDAHETASSAHQAAMLAAAKANDPEAAADHAKAMAAHDACADGHCKEDDEAVEASMKVIGEFVKAGGPGSGPRPNPQRIAEADSFAKGANALGEKAKTWQEHSDAGLAHERASSLYEKAGSSSKASEHYQKSITHYGTARGMTDVKTKASDASAKDIIHCRANAAKITPSKPWALNEPVSFMYMPGGISTITAGFRDKAINITVDVDPDAAKTVQASYENLRQNLPKQQPFGCIEHREEEASVRASGDSVFAWGEYDGDEGILITAEPTKLGMDNVNGRVHRSWSPSFATDADYSKAKLAGGVWTFPEGARGSTSNPARITGIDFCFGTLTNKPAFRNMPPVKAKAASGEQKQEPVTVETIFARLEAPSAVDIVFSKLRRQSIGEPVTAVTADDVFNRLAGKKVMAGGPGSGRKAGSSETNSDREAASQQAEAKTATAEKSGTPEDHEAAAAAHTKAMDMYNRHVDSSRDPKPQSTRMASYHRGEAQFHESQAGAANEAEAHERNGPANRASESKLDSSTILARLEQGSSPVMK